MDRGPGEDWLIHRNEARYLRLRALADSINDTARMARNTLTLALLVALYLGVTLLSSSDLNLFLNGQVVLPQVGTGVSVVQSYIFAPPVFLFLHVQALLLLNTLARKVRVFDAALSSDVPAEERSLYKEWLSGFGFVQVVRSNSAFSPSRVVFWLSACVLPPLLLFLRSVLCALPKLRNYRVSSPLGDPQPGQRMAVQPVCFWN